MCKYFSFNPVLIDVSTASNQDTSVIYNLNRKNVSNEEKLDFISNNLIEIQLKFDDDNETNHQIIKSLRSVFLPENDLYDVFPYNANHYEFYTANMPCTDGLRLNKITIELFIKYLGRRRFYYPVLIADNIGYNKIF